MSTSERFPNHREPACAASLGQAVSAQPSPPGDVLDGEGELVGGSPEPPSLETQARHARWLKTLDRHQAERRRVFKELREWQSFHLLYKAWEESVPAHEIRPLGAALAKRLAAHGKTFVYRSTQNDLNLGLAFLHLLAADMGAFLRLWLDEPSTGDVRLLEHEYWEIAGNPVSATWELETQAHDRRRRQRAMRAKRSARYIDVSSFPLQFAQAARADADYARKVRLRHDVPLEEMLVAPDNPHEEVLASFEETLTLERCLSRLSSKERVAFNRWWAHKPPLDNAESCARQRFKKKIRFYLVAKHIREKGMDADMSAAVANDLADLKLGQRMQGETLDEILRGVEALRARDLEVVDDEEDTGA